MFSSVCRTKDNLHVMFPALGANIAVKQTLSEDDVDVTEMDPNIRSDLTICSLSIYQHSDVTATKSLTWNKAILSDYGEFKRVDPENEAVMLKNSTDCFKCLGSICHGR
jgi:hypothetical protein